MLAASFWSLLAPAIVLSGRLDVPTWFPAAVGVLAGAGTIRLADRLLPHLHPLFPPDAVEGLPTRWQRATLLVLAITLHNIPEGLAIGVAFGAAASGVPHATVAGAVALTIGIALQNFPEGVAVAAPLRREGVSALKSFWYGQLSAVVEPVTAVIGAAAVVSSTGFLPYALSFAAGAMIFVVIEEVIPEAERGGHTDLATMAAMVGFVAMMVLDVGLG
jgi:ZIP family zinc transporter